MNRLITLISIVLAFTLTACGMATAPDKPLLTAKEAPKLVPSSLYIPQPKVDRKGVAIPYKPKANPYLAHSQSVKKEHIQLFIEARRAYQVNNLMKAKSLLKSLTNKTTKLAGPWVMLGEIAIKSNQLDTAETYFSKALIVNKKNVNAYLHLAKVQRMQGKFVNAQNTYVRALALWPDFPEAHLNIGVLYDIYLNDVIKAQKHIEAYQFLTGGKNLQVDGWLSEIKKRTGMKSSLNVKNVKVPIS